MPPKLIKKPKPKADPVQSIAAGDLRDAIKQAFNNDAQEFILRVCSYDHSLNPVQYQAIVKFADATKAWTVGISPDPVEAALEAFTKANAIKRTTLHERSGHVSASYEARLLNDAAYTGRAVPPLRARKVFGKALRKVP